MSRHRSLPVRAKAVLSVLLLVVAAGAVACDEDGKTAPERCADPALPIYDIQAAGAPADDNQQFPCVTKVGHAISQKGPTTAPTTSTAGSAGKAPTGSGDAGTAGAGAGGAP